MRFAARHIRSRLAQLYGEAQQFEIGNAAAGGVEARVRSESARRLLGEARLNIAQVGVAVGFRDAREFRRAFKRWTGVAPQSLRRTVRAAPARG